MWTPSPRVLRDIKLGRAPTPIEPGGDGDFALKAEVCELLDVLDREQTFTVEMIE